MIWVCKNCSEVPDNRIVWKNLGKTPICPWCRTELEQVPDGAEGSLDDGRVARVAPVQPKAHWCYSWKDGQIALKDRPFTAITDVQLGIESAARRAERYEAQAAQVEKTWPLFCAAVLATARATYPDAKIIEIEDEIIIQLQSRRDVRAAAGLTPIDDPMADGLEPESEKKP